MLFKGRRKYIALLQKEHFRLKNETESLKLQLGRIMACQIHEKSTLNNIAEAEFKVFSQWGDDGIIQYLIKKIDIENDFFIEFGVENYLESNTRFLLLNNNWSGLVMDGNKKNIEYIKNDNIYWRHDLMAEAAFIKAENINALISKYVKGKIGLLHIDLDGNDYWVWKALDIVSPDIAIIEYNSILGPERTVTIPYDPDFARNEAHFSNLYAGASLPALCDLADEKGYYFVGSNSAGNNAYFVKKEKIGDLRKLSAEEGYVESKFRESRNEDGNLTYVRATDRMKLIKGMPFFNTRTHKTELL